MAVPVLWYQYIKLKGMLGFALLQNCAAQEQNIKSCSFFQDKENAMRKRKMPILWKDLNCNCLMFNCIWTYFSQVITHSGMCCSFSVQVFPVTYKLTFWIHTPYWNWSQHYLISAILDDRHWKNRKL